MQTNRTFNKRFNETNNRQFDGHNTLIGCPTIIKYNAGYFKDIDLYFKEFLKYLESDGFRFYQNQISEFEVDGSGEITKAKMKFIKVKAADLPIFASDGDMWVGFTDEELTKYKSNLEKYNIQGWGIEIPKNINQLSEEINVNNRGMIVVRIYNSNYNKGNCNIDILPQIYIETNLDNVE